MKQPIVLLRFVKTFARSCQKSYADKGRKPLEFSVGDLVLLKASPWNGAVRFGKKKLAPRSVSPFKILDRVVGPVAYRLKPPLELSNVHPVFHVSNLSLAKGNLHNPLDEVRIDETMHFVEQPVEIMDHKDKVTKRNCIPLVMVRWNSCIPLVKGRWNSKQGTEFTWEREDHIIVTANSLISERNFHK
ncbi:uncharacterized protein LOC143634559 [Bidens hawaiensis]|uniref:uncharacterized protein LOC143634559 n=1 Tax=Bidens hawaiensis TaxID=980011 RepID=UPI00404AB9FE